MSSVGRNWDSERYQLYESAGLQPGEDELRRPTPHWESMQRLLPSQDDDDWALQGAWSTDEYVLVEEGADDVVEELTEVC